jgi:hypothetical protein
MVYFNCIIVNAQHIGYNLIIIIIIITIIAILTIKPLMLVSVLLLKATHMY